MVEKKGKAGFIEIQFGATGAWYKVSVASQPLANVMCKQLGYKGQVSFAYKNVSTAAKRAALFHAACEGIEHSLAECEIVDVGQETSKSALWLECTDTMQTEGKMRLSGDNSTVSGLAHVFFKGMWRPVLASSNSATGSKVLFTKLEGNAICRGLGLGLAESVYGVPAWAYQTEEANSAYAYQCKGTERTLADCPVRNSSSVGYFAYVKCANKLESITQLGEFALPDLHLTPAADTGFPKVFVGGVHALVEEGSKVSDDLICASLGYNRSAAVAQPLVASTTVASGSNIVEELAGVPAVRLDCTGKKNVSQCSFTFTHSSLVSSVKLRKVKCVPRGSRPQFLKLSVPNVDSVEQIAVKSSANKEWLICADTSVPIADAACKQAGRTQIATQLGKQYQLSAVLAKRAVSASCTGKESSLLECSLSFGVCKTKSGFFRKVVCEAKLNTVPEQTVRQGAHNMVEMFMGDRWYSVCGSWKYQFDNVDNFCRQMKQGGASRGGSITITAPKAGSNSSEAALTIPPPSITDVQCRYARKDTVSAIRCRQAKTVNPMECLTLATATCNSDESRSGKTVDFNKVKLNGTAVMVKRNNKWGLHLP